METKANYVVVGVFTLVVFVAALLVVFFVSRFGESKDMQQLDVRIPNSVTGLGESSSVLFNGIRVGNVKHLSFDSSNPNMVIAQTMVEAKTPITRSTVATLGFQGFTGIAFIELKGGALDEPLLLEAAQNDDTVARIDADPSAINNLLATVQDISSRANSAIGELEGFINDVREPFSRSAKNTQTFTDMLARNSDKFQDIVLRLDRALSDDNQESVIVQARETLKSMRNVANTLDVHIGPIADNIQRFSGQGLKGVEGLIQNSRGSLGRIDQTITDFERNPQRLIWGGAGSVPQFDGRKRR